MTNQGFWEPGFLTLPSKTQMGSDILHRRGILEIIYVHGLQGKRENTSITEHITTYIANARVSTFDYEFKEEGIHEVDIKNAAVAILDGVCKEKLADKVSWISCHLKHRGIISSTEVCKDVHFIGHNIGGLIIKETLLMANGNEKYSAVARDTSLLLFFGTPQRAKDQAGWERLANNLIHAVGQKNKAPLSGILLLQSSFALKDVNERYARLANFYNVVSYYETEKVDGFADLVLDQYSSTMDLPNECILPRDTNHLDLCRNIKDTDEIFTAMCDKMSTASAIDSHYIKCLHQLYSVSEATRISPQTLPKPLEPRWILKDKTYLEFVNQETGILRILGQSGSGLSTISAIVASELAQVEKLPNSLTVSVGTRLKKRLEDPTILAYSFNTQDYRTCCTSALFASLLLQLIEKNPGYFGRIRKMYVKESQWDWTSSETLWALFRCIMSSPNTRRVYCVIDGLNNCDPERNHLLGDFLSLATCKETKLKIVFTNNSGIVDAYQCTSTIDIDKQDDKQADLEALVDFNMTELLASKPEFGDFAKDIRERILDINLNFLTITLIFKWFHDSEVRSSPSKIEQLLENMPSSLPEIYERVYLRGCLSAPEWKLKALSWITYTFRPLEIEELATALAIEFGSGGYEIVESKRPQNLAEDLKQSFGSFLHFQGNEVFLVHESAKEFLLQALKDLVSKNEGREFIDHAQICSLCLDYIYITDSVKKYPVIRYADPGISNLQSTPSLEGTLSLFPYTARYWYLHYRAAEKNDKLLHQVCKFLKFDNMGYSSPWLERYKSPSVKSVHNPLYAATELGLNEALFSLMNESKAWTPLDCSAVMRAASRGDLELIKELRKRGAQINISVSLRMAAMNDHLSVVSYLLKNKSPDDEFPEDLGPALHIAAQNGYVDVFTELLRNNADVNSLINDRRPLHLAVEFGNIEICRKLIEVGVDVDARDKSGWTALHYAAKQGFAGAVTELLAFGSSKKQVEAQTNKDRTALHLAAKSGHLKVIQSLVKAQSNINLVDSKLSTPLHLAMKQEHTDVVQYLIEEGANVNIADNDGLTPLFFAFDKGNNDLVAIIQPKTDDIHHVDNWQNTYLSIAAARGMLNNVNELIELGVDVNAKNMNNQTAVMFAVGFEHLECVKALIAAGADLNILGTENYTPVCFPIVKGNKNMVNALLEAGALPEPQGTACPAVFMAAYHGRVEMVKDFINRKFDIEKRGVHGWTPLHAGYASPEIIDMLLDAGAKTDILSTHGFSPIEIAIKNGCTETVSVYLKKGIDPLQRKGNTGRTHLHHAVLKGTLDCVNLLLKRLTEVASLDITDDQGRTPLYDAVTAGHTQITKALLATSKCDQNQKTPTGKSLIVMATNAENMQMIELLLRNKVQVEQELADRLLKNAAIEGSLSLATTMLEEYYELVNLSNEDEYGWRPEMFAKAYGHVEVFDAIMKGYVHIPKILRPWGWVAAEGENDTIPMLYVCNQPIPILKRNFYFEVKVIEAGAASRICIGLVSENTPLGQLPGWDKTSWGYYSHSGKKYHDNQQGEVYSGAEPYSKGDVVGCLYDIERREISFWKNGVFFGVAFEGVTGRLFPAVGIARFGGSRAVIATSTDFVGEIEYRHDDSKWEDGADSAESRRKRNCNAARANQIIKRRKYGR